MKKVTIIIGPPRRGKSKLAMEMWGKYSSEERAYATAISENELKSKFFLGSCNLKTKCLLVDDIIRENFRKVFVMTSEDIHIHKMLQSPFVINPEKVILCCDESVDAEYLKESNAYNQCEIIDFNKYE